MIDSTVTDSAASASAGMGALELGSFAPVMTVCGAIVGIAVSAAIIAYEPYFWLYEFPEKLR